jgi:ketosteroid isomerase-like protein
VLKWPASNHSHRILPGSIICDRRLRGVEAMKDQYSINVAKTEFREGYNNGDIDRVQSMFSDTFTDMSTGFPSKYGLAAKQVLRDRLTKLFAEYFVKINVIVIDILFEGSIAYDLGWHEFILTPKSGGEKLLKRERYFEMWNKNDAGEWKITYFISNDDVREVVNGLETQWFRSERKLEVVTDGSCQTLKNS